MINQYTALRAYLDFTEQVNIPMFEAIIAWEIWTKYLGVFDEEV